MIIPRKILDLGWNNRVFTYEDGERLCWDEGIWLYRYKMRYDKGVYFPYFDQPIIVISKLFSKGDQLWALWHEITHYYLHPAEMSYFAPGTEDKCDFEANIVASVALIPNHLVETKTFAELQDEYAYPEELLWFRKDIYERYKI